MLYWIDWQFWSWKSALSTNIAREVARDTTKEIMKQKTLSWNIILSNIKMDKEKIPNYFYFEDDKLLEVLRTINSINDLERKIYWRKRNKWWLIQRQRKKFSKFYVFFDEAWAVMNNHIKVKNNEIYAEYVNQNRKNFMDLYLVSAQWSENFKTMRSKVDWWYYVKPLSRLPILNDIWIIRRQKREEDWKTVTMENFVWKDQNWDYILKQKPIDEYMDWFWKPWIWKYYDDLHKNIRDPDKYINIDVKLLSEIINHKSELIEPLINDEDFIELKNNKLLLLDNNKKNVLDKSIN